MVGLRRSSKAFPKAQLAPKKSHGHCLVVCCWSDPLQLSQSWRNRYIWEVCSANWWDALKTAPAASTGWQNGPRSSQQCPAACHITRASKVEQIGPQSFASYAIFTWPLANWLPLLQASRQLLAGKLLPQPAGGRKCFPRVSWILKHGFLHCRDKLISWQKCVDCNGFQLINKNVYEPSYNDLKFTVWNCNYFCTNLILSL